MKFPSPVSVTWIAELINAKIEGNTSGNCLGINEIHKVEEGDLVFVDHPKYYKKCIDSDASFIIINKSTEYPPHKALLIVDDPFDAYQKIVNHFRPFHPQTTMIHSSVCIGEGTTIAPNVFIGEDVVIGNNCIIHPNVTILSHCIIGDEVVIQSGTIIGSDAFYYNSKKNRSVWYKKMKSCGRVILKNHVEIGASCTIDRGVTHDTIIGEGTKMDNMVHIGHDVVVGKNCLFAAQVGIGGATVIKDGVILWGQAGINKTITIGENAIVMGQSGVTNSLEGGKVYFGYPAEEALAKKREFIWIKRIPEMWEMLKKANNKNQE
ncbi:MAG: UDP-3-O-(3-hydroxymyristoyl)glucosamine N-acyltransferase [Chitinophagaceae bacterium]|jgi:UDP-3-O-[3-hydroxymyristoyl] glucosamine N-acyltransferase